MGERRAEAAPSGAGAAGRAEMSSGDDEQRPGPSRASGRSASTLKKG